MDKPTTNKVMDLFKAPQNAAPLDRASEQEKLDWMRLARTRNIGPITFHDLIAHYGTASDALKALPGHLARIGSKKPIVVPDKRAIEKEYKALQKYGAHIIIAAESAYPLSLSALEDAPPVLTCLGDISLMNRNCLAIVGARNASHNGRHLAKKLAADLGAEGQIIVSGLARGIDTAAHEGALQSGTIAVVAGGIDKIYPPENEELYRAIAEQGLIIAESPFGMPPRNVDFPRRNRIVSGLSQGVLVVEANKRSGSLITARLAGEQGRDIFAIPGSPMDPRAEGPNHLIREGAMLIRSADDILEHLRKFDGSGLRDSAFQDFSHGIAANVDAAPPADLETIQTQIMESLSFSPTPIDAIIRDLQINTAQAQQALFLLELSGAIERLPGHRIMRLNQEV